LKKKIGVCDALKHIKIDAELIFGIPKEVVFENWKAFLQNSINET